MRRHGQQNSMSEAKPSAAQGPSSTEPLQDNVNPEASMSRSNDVTTSLRLSCAEAKIIRIGLFSIANGHELWRARGSPPYSPARMLFQRCRVDEGEYSAEDLATVSRVAATATFTSQSRRLRLDPLELAACAFGAR